MTVNLATDPEAVAAYDEPGSWGRLSEGWPETPYTIGKMLLCSKAGVVPYGQYVVMGGVYVSGVGYDYSNGVIRCASVELRDKLEAAYNGMFVECAHLIKAELAK